MVGFDGAEGIEERQEVAAERRLYEGFLRQLDDELVAVAQPNYVYTLQQQGEETAPAARGDTGPKGDPAQYILEKLKISDVHRMVRGTNIPIAVIDSEIDAAHPDLEGVIAQRFSAVGAPEKPHSHGTGMAGARRVSLLAPPRRERRSCARGLHVTSVEPSGPFVKRPRRPPVRCPDALLLRVGRWVLKSWLRPPRPGTSAGYCDGTVDA